MIHLDTSYLNRALVRGSLEDGMLRNWLRTGEPLGVSAFAWAEFLCGPLDDRQPEIASSIVPKRVPFDEEHAALSARLFNESGRHRGSLVDCMIASTAVLANAGLATANRDDFLRFREAGLRLAGSSEGCECQAAGPVQRSRRARARL